MKRTDKDFEEIIKAKLFPDREIASWYNMAYNGKVCVITDLLKQAYNLGVSDSAENAEAKLETHPLVKVQAVDKQSILNLKIEK